MEQEGVSERRPARKVAATLLLSAALFLTLELALQLRSHIKLGQSVFNLFTQETRYVVDARTALKVLRPNHTFQGNKIVIKTNAQGLRSETIEQHPPPETFRVAIIGASTVMGAYSATNEDTFPYQLQKLLNQNKDDGITFEVINAGIPGYGLVDQTRMAERLILPLKPRLVIVYPGFNDFAQYCSSELNRDKISHRRVALPSLKSPSWLLTTELVRKNTIALRTPPLSDSTYRSVANLDLLPYRKKLDDLIKTLRKTNVSIVLATNARAYRRDQSMDQQLKLSETARFYNPCFDLAGLHDLYDTHNKEIILAAERHGVKAIMLGDLMPGGPVHFIDASHFSHIGERVAAEHLFQFLVDHGLVSKKLQ